MGGTKKLVFENTAFFSETKSEKISQLYVAQYKIADVGFLGEGEKIHVVAHEFWMFEKKIVKKKFDHKMFQQTQNKRQREFFNGKVIHME